ncbi:hypothetical protein LCGC14_2897910 [marine sediment metagenome]|uniref:Zinc-ribbon domain-containing protein n=1 Tax=marine sediment metagenome TaxID=412755 RepID=A0A0F9A369_9ZZZZ
MMDLIIGILVLVDIVVSVIVAIFIFLIRRHKRKTPKEVIIVQEKEVPKITYCRECGVEIDKPKEFCSRCGTKIN